MWTAPYIPPDGLSGPRGFTTIVTAFQQDALNAYAHAANILLQSRRNIYDGPLLTNVFANVSFMGQTGHVSFRPDTLERRSRFALLNLQQGGSRTMVFIEADQTGSPVTRQVFERCGLGEGELGVGGIKG